MTITLKNRLRQDFAACSTGSPIGDCGGRVGYYETKGHAVSAFCNALSRYDLSLVTEDWVDFNGDSSRTTLGIYSEEKGRCALAVISWYRMSSGCYEFVGYIA